MKLITTALGIASLCAVGLGAQADANRYGDQHDKTSVEVKDGRDIKVVGCLEANRDGGYTLTNSVGATKYALATNDDLAKHVGHMVEVHGKAADLGKAKVKIKSKDGDAGEVGTTGTTDAREKGEMRAKGDLALPFMSVKSVKTIAKSCM